MGNTLTETLIAKPQLPGASLTLLKKLKNPVGLPWRQPERSMTCLVGSSSDILVKIEMNRRELRARQIVIYSLGEIRVSKWLQLMLPCL